jgi:PAS domain S-box-containing protein
VGICDDLPYLKPEEDGRLRSNHRLRALSDAMPGVRTINIINAAGINVGSNWEELIGSNFAERDYFKTPRRHPDPAMLYVSAPFKTVLGVFAINLVRVVTGPGGEFAGIVAATLDPEFFTVLLESVLYVPDMRASVNHGEGKVFLIVPDSKGVEGMDLAKPGSFHTRHTESKQTDSLFTGIVYATGDERMIAIRTVTSDKFIMDTPLMVAVSRDLSVIFAAWRNEAIVQGVFFGVLALAAGCGLYIYQRREGKFSRIETGHVARLQEREERYRTLFARAGDGIILLSGDGTLVEVNESFARMHGYSAQEMRNMNLKDLDTPDTFQLSPERMRRILDGETLVFEVEHYHKDGHVFHLEVSASLISSGGISFVQSFHRDITERKRAEEALREAHKLLTSISDGSTDAIYGSTG